MENPNFSVKSFVCAPSLLTLPKSESKHSTSFADLRPCELHVIEHGPDREERSNIDQPEPPHTRIDNKRRTGNLQRPVEQQHWNRNHLADSLEFAERIHRYAL